VTRRARGRVLALAAALIVTATPAAEPLRVLFVGNSLTYANDLPRMVRESAASVGVTVDTATVVFPNVNLEDHFARGAAQEAIKKGHFDVVVLQQGPSSQPEGRIQMMRDTCRFAAVAKKAGSRTAVFMVWPSTGRSQDWNGVVKSATDAAEACGATLLPVGTTWRAALAENPASTLYGPDGFHPSIAGTRLAARVITATLLNRSPREFPDPPPSP
jgi:hypothetical protein